MLPFDFSCVHTQTPSSPFHPLLPQDLSRVGADRRAVELFDQLRALPERHALRPLCDVYSFTAMVSMCIYQQDVERALELVEDMRQVLLVVSIVIVFC